MTPKEKAKSLVKKFNEFTVQESIHYPNGKIKEGYSYAIQCALIAVEEMLNNAGFIWGGRDTETALSARDEYRKYWNEVKTEIEKL